MLRVLLAMAMLAMTPVTAHAQDGGLHTKVLAEGASAPPATIADVAWLVGRWEGEGIEGLPSTENWLPPTGSTMVGTFVQQGEDGGILFTEHMYLLEQDGSLAVKLKHFNADLTGWEDAGGMETFPLVALEPCAAYFNGLTYRCEPDGGLLVAVRMESESEAIEELVFRFRKASQDRPARCAEAMTTHAIDACLADALNRAEHSRARYLAAALERLRERPEVARMVASADKAFLAYRDTQCDAVLEDWKDGTIRGAMALSCRIDLTEARTHTIWRDWLTYLDSTPPLLPEPSVTQ